MVCFIKRFTSFRLGIWKEKRVTYTGSDCFMQKLSFCLQSSLSASRFAAEQTLYGLMNNRLVSAVVINPSSEGLTDHSTGGLMLQGMHKSEGFIRPYGV